MKNKTAIMVLIGAIAVVGGIHKQTSPDYNEEVHVAEATIDAKLYKSDVLNFEIDPFSEKYAGLNTKNFGWGFKKEKNAAPDIPLQTVELLEKNNTYFIDKKGGKVLYLTFDEGYENGYTGAILDVLKEKQVPAAFFITGPYLNMQEELVSRMINEGHVVGNHTVNHPNLAKSDLSKVKSELMELDKVFFEKYGKSMIFMRPPEGECSEKMLAFVSDMGYKTVLWSFAYKDWDINVQRGSRYAYEQVIPYLHDGAIILLHAVSSDNAGALGDIIDYARNQGYEFKSLEELL